MISHACAVLPPCADGRCVSFGGADSSGRDARCPSLFGGSGIYTAEKGVFKFYGDELVGYAFDSETREAMREFFDTAYWCG